MIATRMQSAHDSTRSWALRLMGAGMALAAGLLAACGGGGMAGTTSLVPTANLGCSTSANCGTSMVTLQDAAGDFQSYTVDVVSLQLKRADGTLVETLPATTRVDFAQLVDLSELVTAAQIPAGDYTGATLTLSYANASILADDGSGGSVALAPVDASGAALTGSLTLALQLDAHNHFVITPNRIARLALDFNLAVSNTVNLAGHTVTVSPLLQASLVPPATDTIHVRGTLASADTAAQAYTVNVRPFHLGSGTLGQVTVHVASTTSYEIDGTAYTGAAGLAALAMEPANTLVAALGTLDTATLTFTATSVLAGTSLPGGSNDLLEGVVVARTGNTLSVRGGNFQAHDGSFSFLGGPITVTVGSGTRVVSAGDTAAHAIGDISVGQHITATGTATVNATAGTATLDATAGRVRLEYTTLWGLATGSTGSPLHLQLQAIEGRAPSLFNFAGTGATPAQDANPAAYAVDTGVLPLSASAMAAGPTRLFGFVVPFGTATTVDFRGLTLETFAQTVTDLELNWAAPGSTGAFPGLTATSSSLSLSYTGAGAVHFLQTGPLRTNLLGLATPPQIVGDMASTSTGYAIGHAHSHAVETFKAFSDFVAALAADVQGTTTVLGVDAHGQYDSPSNTFTAHHMAVLLGN